MNSFKTSLAFLFLAGVLGFSGAFRAGAETAEAVSPENPGAAIPVWRQSPGGVVIGIPAIQAGSVVAALDGGHLRAYSLAGRPLWDYYAQGRLIPYVSRSREGTCYICRSDGTLISVNRSGRELWRTKTGPLIAPAISGWDGRIFAAAAGRIFCFTASGYQLWSRTLDRAVVFGPLLTSRGGIAAALDSGDLLELDPFGRTELRPLGEVPQALVSSPEGILVLLKSGEIRLAPPGPAPVKTLAKLPAAPLGGTCRGNGAAFLLANGQLARISLSTGERLWTGDTHIRAGEIQSPRETNLLWDNRGIYVFSIRGATGFSGEGSKYWQFRLNGAASMPALSDEGTLISGGVDWLLYAYRLEHRTIQGRQSLYGPVPEGNYGLSNPPSSPWASYLLDEPRINDELKRLARLIREGRVGEEEPVFAAFLREIAGAAMGFQVSPTHPRVQVKQRAEAARLLGFISCRETIPFLAELYGRDRDPAVKSAAAEAIGRIGVDPDGVALLAFSRMIGGPGRDDQVLTATAQAIGALCRFSGPPLSDEGARLLTHLEGTFMPPRVRNQARREIARLAGQE